MTSYTRKSERWMKEEGICSMLDILVRKLERRDDLREGQRETIRRLPLEHRVVRAGDLIVREGDRQAVSLLLISGFAGRFALLGNGGRQFTELALPGDFMDLHAMVMKRLDHSVAAISTCELAAIPHGALKAVMANDPHLARLFWLETVVDAAIHRVWLVALGRQDAQARMAHLFCETKVRLEVVGLATDDGFDFPLNQTELADVLGLSTVHVNRTLMALRSAQLVDWRDGRVILNDWPRLVRLAEFDPLYLRLWKEAV
jgi:CRP-like cAMP-binding protein